MVTATPFENRGELDMAQPVSVLRGDDLRRKREAMKVVTLARKLRADGISIKGVRLDSGDLAMHANRVRRILDEGGLENTTIFASPDQPEWLSHVNASVLKVVTDFERRGRIC